MNTNLFANCVNLKRVEQDVTYLRCQLNAQWEHFREIKIRIEKTRATK